MRSLKSIHDLPAGMTLTSDELVEFHGSRLLLLIAICGKLDRKLKQPRIEGLTKFAKLDFFIRYPEFFKRAAQFLNKAISVDDRIGESRMIRFHYGPWDKRYYQVLPYLEARGLINILKEGNKYQLYLTEKGKGISEQLLEAKEFNQLFQNISQVKSVLGSFSGNRLKNLVYRLFDQEVKQRKLGEIIK